ncbi:hypothetical protein [Loktanella sp. M215]|uniref:hypothetical protein n=1 Tax=Loktanella sp. M215 TaxID=2675431 RepID=UPI001F339E6D|nr:hypothetical protein [Loktanella sp. M215]MCF7700923.1 hypothetical protein [Loktanella sp. M215]
MTRQERRKVKATAAKTAALFARVCTDYGPDGQLTPVDHPKAVAALQRAFHRLLQNGGEPQVMRLTLAEAEAFPRKGADLKGAHPYLAVGLDPDVRGTYSLRHIYTPGAPADMAEMCNRNASLHHLRPHIRTRGFSAGPTTGGA